ncbi:pseudouridylate synthase 7 homolog [Anthonomus grandis grandis]|uniref:pseudouridylate synthase 7 homolog n=1 Tax=Anthonomus grandis grandis TaxID=2921223 RepID=UPI0021657661|nr:pseudouridylate synthase 7 homolog [Anthonomus grandis grandis]
MPFRGRNRGRSGGPRRGRGGHDRKRGRGGHNAEKSNWRSKREYQHYDQLQEQEVGITEYISPLEAYEAIIKARFSDFHVNEIDRQGRMAELTDLSIPAQFNPTKASDLYKGQVKSPLDKIPQEVWQNLLDLVEKRRTENVELEAENLDKQERKSVHLCVKEYFGQKIISSTIKKDEKAFFQFKKSDSNNKGVDLRNEWPENCPEFTHFILFKERMDTMDACLKLSEALHVSPQKIMYAGTKDKRAKTSQWLCVKKFNPHNLVKKVRNIYNMRVGNFEFKPEGLKLGQLKGNRFRIALRNVKADDELIKNSLEHIKEHGFINYYGLQRFGNDKAAPTYNIGKHLLKGEWKEAIDLILKVKPSDDPQQAINKAKKEYAECGDAKKAAELCDKYEGSVEKHLLNGLASVHANDYVTALEEVPRNMRLLYIHSFQSLIWNQMVSKRIKQFGLRPVQGDLVFEDNSEDDDCLVPINDVNDSDKTNSESNEDKPDKPKVRALKVDELENFTIFDIVLPLPGYDIVYPDNMKEFYQEVMNGHGISLEMPKQSVKTYNLSGTYRKIIQKPENLEWKIMLYNDPTDNLILSDLEALQKKPEPQSAENGKYKAIVVSFTLKASQYATMVLREVMKCNTSTSYQASMNDYGEKKVEKKIILEESAEGKKEEGPLINEAQEGSLLNDKAKYEDFKNSLFKDILGEAADENGVKRTLEDEDSESSKKQKVDPE